MTKNEQVHIEDFFAQHPVFTLDEAAECLDAAADRIRTQARLKYHLKQGRLKKVTRGAYAVVPRGYATAQFQPDAFLVGRALRPEGVFGFHSALELLGAAHSVWHEIAVLCASRRAPLEMGGQRILFMEHPIQLRRRGYMQLGTRQVERLGQLLRVTGPERTLLDGFRRPDLCGGLAELLESAGGFPTLDLDLLENLLQSYAMAKLWAAVGWFLEIHQQRLGVPDAYLEKLEQRRPGQPHYLDSARHGGRMLKRWHLIVAPELLMPGEADAR